MQGPRVLSRLTGPTWDACDGLEPEDVGTDDGANMILDTLAEVFQGEHETELFDALEDRHFLWTWQEEGGRGQRNSQLRSLADR